MTGGIAEALVIGAGHINGDDCALILGDNIFHGNAFSQLLRRESRQLRGCTLFGYRFNDPQRYGIGVTDVEGRLVAIDEKPTSIRQRVLLPA